MSRFFKSPLLILVVLAFVGAPRVVLAQRAVLYEGWDGADQFGRRLVGSADWESTRLWVGEGRPPERTIGVEVLISERWRATLSLRRNTDTTLLASHIVEVYFRSHGGSLPNVRSVLGMVARQSDGARGEPIVGVAVQGASTSFLIGLSNVEADKQRNLYFLKESAWLDLAMLYNDGSRAMLSMEKGAVGMRMFNNGFSEWGYTRLTAPPAKAPPPSAPPPSSAKSSGQASQGSGFFISTNGHVVTNAHVVRDCSKISVRKPAESGVIARVLARVDADDLAVLKVERRQEAAATIRSIPSPRTGEAIVVFGFPLPGFLASSGNATIGNITALAGLGDDPRELQISAPVQPGNSGGPVLDASGNVIGVVVSKLDALKVARLNADIPQNINFAVKSSTLMNFLDARGIAYSIGQIGETLSTPDIVERAKAISVEVRCEK